MPSSTFRVRGICLLHRVLPLDSGYGGMVCLHMEGIGTVSWAWKDALIYKLKRLHYCKVISPSPAMVHPTKSCALGLPGPSPSREARVQMSSLVSGLSATESCHERPLVFDASRCRCCDVFQEGRNPLATYSRGCLSLDLSLHFFARRLGMDR